jgi:hypothetical protein
VRIAPPSPLASRQRDEPASTPLADRVGAVGLLTAEAEGQVRIHLDVEEFDFHMDVAPDADANWIKSTLNYLRLLGYEPIPLDEADPEFLDDDWVRRYLVPLVAVEHRSELSIVAPRVAA